MNKRKLILALLTLVFVISICGCNNKKKTTKNEETGSVVTPNTKVATDKKQVLNLYYYNHSDYDYISKVIDKLSDQLPNVTIYPIYQNKEDFIEKLVKNNNDTSIADIYLISENELERAYLAGITSKNYSENYNDRTQYPKASVDACSYKGSLIAYPLYFNTQVMVCNESFGMVLPHSYEELKSMTTSFEVKEGMVLTNILNWDISDIGLNYTFVGKYLDACGKTADNKDSISIDNDNVLSGATYLKELAGFFNINRENVSKDKVIEAFCAGTTAFAIVNSDDLKTINDAVDALGEQAFDYVVCEVPNIDDNKETAGLSETVMMVVNPFSQNKDMASFVAQIFSSYSEECVYETIGKFPTRIKSNVNGRDMSAVYRMYDRSHSHIKLMESGDFYTRLDIAFHNVCDGSDVKEVFSALQEYLKLNLN